MYDRSNSGHEITWVNSPDTAGGYIDLKDGGDLQFADHADWDFGAGDFTIELFAWTFVSSWGGGGYSVVFGQWKASTNQRCLTLDRSGATSKWRVLSSIDGTNAVFHESTVNPALDTEYDICVERAGDVLRVYIDGVEIVNSALTGTLHNSTAEFLICNSFVGGASPGLSKFKAARATKGVARYNNSGGYTVPLLPLPTA